MSRNAAEKETGRTTAPHGEWEKALRQLRRDIYSGRRLPRERLVEKDLARDLSAGRMAVRQALARLEEEGLVRIEPYKGAAVAGVSLERILESYRIHAMLEGQAALLAADRLDEGDLTAICETIRRQRALGPDRVQDWQDLNHQFHRLINLKCDNHMLVELIRRYSQFTSYWFIVMSAPGRIPTNIDEHREILEALSRRDGSSARELMENHIIGSGRYLVDFVRQHMPLGLWGEGAETERKD
ncbi:MAG: GntR family transcriptional regulator [Proteobacteria bacterium]|nr:GntR family transcriptional regulator [Pseudomonadota bacterium]